MSTWLLSASERGNPRTRLDDVHPGEQAWSSGNRVRALVHGATYFAELFDRLEATRDGDLVLFTDWQGDADERLTGEPGSEVVEVLGRARRARRRRAGPGVALAPGLDRLPRQGEPPPRTRAAAAWRRGHPRHAGAAGWLAPPEDGGHPAPGRLRARHRVRRRDRPVPLPARRRRPPRRPAGAGARLRVRRHAAVARHPVRHPGPGRPRRRDGLPRTLGGPDQPEPLADPAGARPAARPGHLARPAARPGTSTAAGRGRHARGAAAAHLPEPAAREGLRVRPGWRAQRGPRLHQGRRARPVAHLRGGPVPVGPSRR